MIFHSYIPEKEGISKHINSFMQGVESLEDFVVFYPKIAKILVDDCDSYIQNVIDKNPEYQCFTCFTNEPRNTPPGFFDSENLEEQFKFGNMLKMIYQHKVEDVSMSSNPIKSSLIILSKKGWQDIGRLDETDGQITGKLFRKSLLKRKIKIGLIKGLYSYILDKNTYPLRKEHIEKQALPLSFVFELPHNSKTSGGVIETLALAEKMKTSFVNDVHIRFQKIIHTPTNFSFKWSVGMPDKNFPSCDVCITYSDNPHLDQLVNLPQVKKVIIYMLSFGMAPERERKNIFTNRVTVTCSSKKLETLIAKEGATVRRVGFGLKMNDIRNYRNLRKNVLAIRYHPSALKRYNLAVTIADELYRRGLITGVISFGVYNDGDHIRHPNGLIKFYPNATRKELEEIFNSSKLFLFPSTSEGLSLTPIESTICGCPAIICDGAINEVFFDQENCFVARKDDTNHMIELATEAIENYEKYALKFEENMIERIDEHSWDRVCKNFIELV